MPSEVATNLQDRLEEIIGAGYVDSTADTLASFTLDGMAPLLVARPGTQEEVAAVVTTCASTHTAMIPWGGGTAIGMGNAPNGPFAVIRMDRLDRIVEFDAENLCVTVEAGMPLARLQAVIADKKELLPLDPPAGERVTLGGLVAANQSGPSRLQHGTARDWVLGLRVVLPDGERIRCGGRVIKNVSGYDMNKLFIRSFGTLGIITEVTVKLLPIPEARGPVLGVFQELRQAAEVVEQVLGSFLLPEALELLDPTARKRLPTELVLGSPEAFLLAVGMAGSQASVDRQIRDLKALVEAGGGQAICLREAASSDAWKAITNVLRPSVPEPEGTICRLSVPIGRTACMMAAIRQRAASHSLTAAVAAHAGSGLLRVTLGPLPSLPAERGSEALVAAIESLRKEVEEIGGSLILEEASMAIKQRVDAWGALRSDFGIMKRIKGEFDPLGLFSPGRFVGRL